MLLAEAGLDVTVFDKDAAGPPDNASAAWESWHRPGVAQFRQAHTLLPRGREILRKDLPRVHAHLENLGSHEFSLVDPPPPGITDWSPEPGDERFSSLGARRPVYELAFALAADETSGVEVRRGKAVNRLLSGTETLSGIPHVVGVETDAGRRIQADLVIDAAGRRSPLPALLEEIGARPVREDTEDSRFTYYTRFYGRADGGGFPEPYTISLFPVGSISILTLPGDNDTWSVTLFATTADKAMRAARDPDVFERVVRAHPLRAHWVDGEALTDVDVMAGISDRERSLFFNGSPVTTGVVSVADAWACTNPSLGRGITMALMHISALAPALVESLDRPAELAESWHAITQGQLQPWHRATLDKDRARNKEMDAVRTGTGDPDGLPSVLFDGSSPEEAAFFAAMMIDKDMFRAGLEMAGLFHTREEVMSRPDVREKLALTMANMPELPPVDVPTRSELEDLLS